MADEGPPAPPPPVIPLVVPPDPLMQLPVPPAQPIQPTTMPQLNWSHFKPEFVGKPDEDAEAHLLRTNNWMDTDASPEADKVQILCLTLVGEAIL